MLTISLDEQGDFEEIKQEHEPIFVAGVVFDDCGDSTEEQAERARVENYYKKVIQSVSNDSDSFVYPAALHSNGNRNRDRMVIAPVKQKVKDTIHEFLEKGTFEGRTLISKPRTGNYKIFVVFKTENGMKELLDSNANILARDDYASNLYYHMTSLVIKKLVFHNPDYELVRNVKLNIATRRTPSLSPEEPLSCEYRKLGYIPDRDSQPDKIFFRLTNADTYRSVIAEEIIHSGKSKISIEDFRVRAINYNDSRNMEFLYLADSICSILGFKVSENTGSDLETDWFREIISRADEIIGKENLVMWTYDSIDSIFNDAWEKLEKGDYYEALKSSYRLENRDTVYSKYYVDRWCSLLKSRIIQRANLSDMVIAVQKLSESVRTNKLNQGELVTITETLETAAESLKEGLGSVTGKKMLYNLYDTGVSAFTHIGDSAHAEQYFEKCKRHMTVVGLDGFLSTQNKVAVYYNDYFRFADAMKLAKENVEYYELLKELQESLPFEEAAGAGIIGYAKAISQYAQSLAFMRDPSAEDAFRRALEQFTSDSTDYKQTQSYLLHFYLDTGNREKYLEESASYFGGEKNLSRQLNYIIREGCKRLPLINLKYAYYVWVRGLYLFRRSEASRLWDKIQNFENSVRKEMGQEDWKLENHPAEIIYKYLMLLAEDLGESEKASIYRNLVKNSSRKYGATVDAIIQFGFVEAAYYNAEDAELGMNMDDLISYLQGAFDTFSDKVFSDDIETRYQELSQYFSFMYH